MAVRSRTINVCQINLNTSLDVAWTLLLYQGWLQLRAGCGPDMVKSGSDAQS